MISYFTRSININGACFRILSVLILSGCTSNNKKSNFSRQNPNPNVVFILVDDLGYGELSSYGQTHFSTPNIDKLVQGGMKFTDAYAGNTVCAPSRASLITGKHPGHASIRGNFSDYRSKHERLGIKKSDVTTGELFKQADYNTAIVGKWHIFSGNMKDSSITFPNHRGYDLSFRYRFDRKAKDYRKKARNEFQVSESFPSFIWENDHKVFLKENFHQKRKYLDDFVNDRALTVIEDNKNHPFYLDLNYKIPHSPEVLADTSVKYKQKGWPEVERVHALRVEKADSLVGTVIDKLKSLNLYKNTLIIFTSDNGGHHEGGHSNKFFGSNAPLRGAKRDLYEGGIRVPLIAVWDGVIPNGSVSSYPIAFWDFNKTYADMLNINPDAQFDGVSLLPVFKQQEEPKRKFLYWEFHTKGDRGRMKKAVRKGKWKAVKPAWNSEIELYNLQKDIDESNNIAQDHLKIIKKMRAIMDTASTKSARWYYGEL